ncbi:MAG TPA: hypothetical protein V6C97_34200 [Oculatellaceae cyanobacterium]
MQRVLLAVACIATLASAANAQGRSIYVEQSGTRGPNVIVRGHVAKFGSSTDMNAKLRNSDTAEIKKMTRVETGKAKAPDAMVGPSI